MQKKQNNSKPKVLFNASVVLAGLYSPTGGSAKVLDYVQKGKVVGLISEIIFDEIIRHSGKVGISKKNLSKECIDIFKKIYDSPNQNCIDIYNNTVTDVGDCHLFASAEELGADYLVSLDKKHVLILKKRFKKLKIVSPAELIALFS